MKMIHRNRQVMEMVTIKDVAKAAGVGLGTASRALTGNGSVRSDTKKKVAAAAEKLWFVIAFLYVHRNYYPYSLSSFFC